MSESVEKGPTDSQQSADGGGPVVEVEAMLEDLIPEFLDEIEEDVDDLRNALGDGNYERIEQIAHDLKGTGAGYGFDRITELGKMIEAATKRRDDPAVEEYLGALETYLDEVEVEYV